MVIEILAFESIKNKSDVIFSLISRYTSNNKFLTLIMFSK